MKFFVTLTIVTLVVVQLMKTEAKPLGDDEVQEQDSGLLVRNRRATCDLLSGLGVKDSLCAAHCLTKWKLGYRGGYCTKGVCICRK